MPTCAQARPSTCPCCGAAGRPVGGRLAIVGHGTMERQVRGPATPAGPPEQRVVRLRRYRCRACAAVLVVGPRGLVVRRWYGAGAIAIALAAFAGGATSAEVRARTSPARVIGGAAAERWVTLVRWTEAARAGDLFGIAGLGALRRQDVAHHVTLALAARGAHQLGADLVASAFAGAAAAA